MPRLTYVGKCVECGASLYYNADEEKLVIKGAAPDCLCHLDWPDENEEDERLQEYGEEKNE